MSSEDSNRAVLTITSAELSAAELIERVGLEPDRQWTKGQPRSKEARHGVYPVSGIDYVSHVDGALEPDDHVADLRLRLSDHFVALKKIAKTLASESGNAGVVRCWIYHHASETTTGFDLAPGSLKPFIDNDCLIGISVVLFDDEQPAT
jgi:hypothetical protein